MRSLTLVSLGRLEWRDLPAPNLEAPVEALVRPLAVARCDLDTAILHGDMPFRGRGLHWLRDHLPESVGQRRLFRNAPFKGPYPFGHEGVAEVVKVGAEVRTVRVGQRVVVPFQISCGACRFCQKGLTANCEAVPPRSMYGLGTLGGTHWGGFMSDLVRVPYADAMLLGVPDGVDPVAIASASDNIVDGLRTVAAPLAAQPGAEVLVVGGGATSIGLYAAGLAVALGASRVHYLDQDRVRLDIAERLGAIPLERPYQRTQARCPITVDASGRPNGLTAALLSTEPGGTCTSVGIYPNGVGLPLLSMYGEGVTFVTGRASARAGLPTVLGLVAAGRFKPELVTTRVCSWEEAPQAMLDRGPKVVASAEPPT